MAAFSWNFPRIYLGSLIIERLGGLAYGFSLYL